MRDPKISVKEYICIAVISFFYLASLYISGGEEWLSGLWLLVPTILVGGIAIFMFGGGSPNQLNRKEGIAIFIWFVVSLTLVFIDLVTATGTLPLALFGNEFFNWILIVLIPVAIVKISNKSSLKETLKMIGFRSSSEPRWKMKTFLMCLILLPFLILMAVARFSITFTSFTDNILMLLVFPFAFILMLFTAGTTEEIFYRGIIQRNVYNATKSQIVAVLCSSLAFAVFHISFAYFLWPHTQGIFLSSITGVMVEQFVAGVMLGIVYARANNLWVPIALHSLINSVWITASFFTENPVINITFG